MTLCARVFKTKANKFSILAILSLAELLTSADDDGKQTFSQNGPTSINKLCATIKAPNASLSGVGKSARKINSRQHKVSLTDMNTLGAKAGKKISADGGLDWRQAGFLGCRQIRVPEIHNEN